MKKVLFQGITIVLAFLLTWGILLQFDWMRIFKVKQQQEKTEEKLGKLIWSLFAEQENKEPQIIAPVDSVLTHICTANNIDREKIQLHIVNEDEVNAFALPNGHLVVNSGLIVKANDQHELAGVISHEIAHIELNHVMQKLIQEIGLSALISITTGNNSTQILQEAAKMLSSSAFERTLEKEADIQAVDYMLNAQLKPESFANFMYKLASEENSASKYLVWISSHPESKERANYIINYSKGKTKRTKNVIAAHTWSALQNDLKKN